MSNFYDEKGSTLTQNRKKKALENVINQLSQSTSKQSYSHILIQQSKPQSCIEKLNSSQYYYARSKQDRNIINSSLLQDIGIIDLEIQKMTVDYETPTNQTQIMNSNNRLFNLKAIVSQLNQTDASKSDFKISLINKIKKSNGNHYKLHKYNEGSYSKLAESQRNSSNQKNMVEVKIIDIPKQNASTTKNQADVISPQNIIKSQNHQVKKLSLKINSERNKVNITQPIQKHNSFHAKKSSDIQMNQTHNVPKKLGDVHDEIKKIIKDGNKLEKAVKIYNTLKHLVQQQSIFQSREIVQKEYKNRIIQ